MAASSPPRIPPWSDLPSRSSGMVAASADEAKATRLLPSLLVSRGRHPRVPGGPEQPQQSRVAHALERDRDLLDKVAVERGADAPWIPLDQCLLDDPELAGVGAAGRDQLVHDPLLDADRKSVV